MTRVRAGNLTPQAAIRSICLSASHTLLNVSGLVNGRISNVFRPPRRRFVADRPGPVDLRFVGSGLWGPLCDRRCLGRGHPSRCQTIAGTEFHGKDHHLFEERDLRAGRQRYPLPEILSAGILERALQRDRLRRHCERSEAIQCFVFPSILWIATSLRSSQ